jgi:translation elongation factor aEF-1 beta
MGIALFKFKLMPESPEIDFEDLKKVATDSIEKITGKITGFEEQEIGFGLKALIVSVRIQEAVGSDSVENALNSLPGVSSMDMIDYRRAIE